MHKTGICTVYVISTGLKLEISMYVLLWVVLELSFIRL